MEDINQKVLERYFGNLLFGFLMVVILTVLGVISGSFEAVVILILTANLLGSEQISRKLEIRR